MTRLSFLVFADLHYKQGMYATTVADLQTILDRAAESRVDFILHAGDFCNDYPGSPEITEPYLHDPRGLAVYGCYGNHELETAGTAMTFVTPRLTNREVVWGTPDGKIGDGSIGYYYFDCKDYRMVVTDTNYSLSPAGYWEHNRTGSYCLPKGNSLGHSLGPDQLLWLEKALCDAAAKKLHCIVVSHATLGTWRTPSPDAAKVRALFAKANALRAGTVPLAINGHHHTDGCKVEEDVIYLDVNAVRNAWWNSVPHEKYTDSAPTFPYIEYDENGAPLSPAVERPLLSLREGKRTMFTSAPLSAIVTIDGCALTVEGFHSTWAGDLAPDTDREEIRPRISSCAVELKA